MSRILEDAYQPNQRKIMQNKEMHYGIYVVKYKGKIVQCTSSP